MRDVQNPYPLFVSLSRTRERGCERPTEREGTNAAKETERRDRQR